MSSEGTIVPGELTSIFLTVTLRAGNLVPKASKMHFSGIFCGMCSATLCTPTFRYRVLWRVPLTMQINEGGYQNEYKRAVLVFIETVR